MIDKFNINQKKTFTIILTLIVLILGVYWPVQNYEFINYDDSLYVTDNDLIQNNITYESIKNTFAHFDTGHWHPLTMLSHMLDWQLFRDNAGGHHWTNVILHIFNTMLLFLFLTKLTGTMWRSSFVALLFAIHPLNVESVAWISERKNVLSTFFFLLTIYLYIWYVQKPNGYRYLLIFLCFVFGLLSKPMLVTLPFVLLLLDYWPLNRMQINSRRDHHREIKELVKTHHKTIIHLVVEKIPLFILSIISSVLTIYASKYVQDIMSIKQHSLEDRIVNALISYALYIKKMFFPFDLAVFYPISDIPTWQFLIALIFLVSITIFVCRYYREYPYLLVGWLWYIGTLVPVIGLVQVGSQSMADRYAYIPLIGMFMMMAWGISDIAYRRIPQNIIIVIISVSLSYLLFLSINQIHYWRNTTALFEKALKVTKNNSIAHFGLGNELLKKNKIDEAMKHYHASLILDPDNEKFQVGFAWAIHMKGENSKALSMLRSALQLNPKSIDAHNKLGYILFQEGYIDEAIIEYQNASALDNKNSLTHNNLGIALMKKGKINEAIDEFQEVLKINPRHAGAHNNIAMLFISKKKNEEAIEHFQEAIILKPEFANAHFHLAEILRQKGRETEANYHYEKAVSINPGYKDYESNKNENKRNNIY